MLLSCVTSIECEFQIVQEFGILPIQRFNVCSPHCCSNVDRSSVPKPFPRIENLNRLTGTLAFVKILDLSSVVTYVHPVEPNGTRS